MESEQIEPIQLNLVEYNGEILKNSNVPSVNHSLESFNHLDKKLDKSHDIRASGTMIKVTYKKESRSSSLSNCNSSTCSDFYNESNCDQTEKRKSSVISYDGSHYSNEEENCTVSSTDGSTFETGREFSTNVGDNGADAEPEEVQNTQVNSTSSLILTPSVVQSRSYSTVKEEEMDVETDSDPTKTARGRKRKMQHVVNDDVESKKLKIEPEIYIDVMGESSSDDEEEEGEEEEEEEEEEDEDEEEEEEEESEEELLLDDPDLPSGWQRIIHTRRGGASDGQNDVHILSPDGKRFRFRAKLKKYLEKINSPYNIDQFYFGLYKKRTHGDSPKVPKKIEDVQVLKAKKKKNKDKVSTPKNKTDAFRLERSGGDCKEIKEINSSNLPSGWRKCLILRENHKNQEKKRVCYVSPDGKIFKQKKRLSDFLTSMNESFNVDLFDFEDCTVEKRPKRKYVKKKDKSANENETGESSPEAKKSAKKELKFTPKKEEKKSPTSSPENKKLTVSLTTFQGEAVKSPEKRKSIVPTSGNVLPQGAKTTPRQEKKKSRYQYSCPPMMHDPHLPTGWKRAIKIRGYGDSAGRMEVIIVSPDGRKHRNRGALEQYLSDKKLPFKSADFDFSLFGRNHKKPPKESKQISPKYSPKPPPKSLFRTDASSSKENNRPVVTPESVMISHVSGIMLTCGITSLRNERRLRMSKEEHEKVLKDYLESNKSDESTGNSQDSSDVPIKWIQDLAKCRSEFGSLSDNAASAIASATKEFLQDFALRAFESSDSPESGLEYNDVADFVEKSECLSPLKVLIPKKITFKEYVKLSRPKKYIVSYT